MKAMSVRVISPLLDELKAAGSAEFIEERFNSRQNSLRRNLTQGVVFRDKSTGIKFGVR